MTRLAILSTASILAVSLPGGCVRLGAPTGGGRPVREVYDEAARGGGRDEILIRPESLPGSGPRTRPVIYPPKVFAVWVQEHLHPKRDLKIGAHWVHFKLRDSSWFPEEIDREPLTGEEAAEEELAPLRAAVQGSPLREIIVPYRPSSAKPSSDGDEPHEPKSP